MSLKHLKKLNIIKAFKAALYLSKINYKKTLDNIKIKIYLLAN